jgi:hypothetical protein
MDERDRIEQARDIVIDIRAMEFDDKIDSVLEKKFIDILILHYRKHYGIEDEDFNEIFEELYGVENYVEEYL